MISDPSTFLDDRRDCSFKRGGGFRVQLALRAYSIESCTQAAEGRFSVSRVLSSLDRKSQSGDRFTDFAPRGDERLRGIGQSCRSGIGVSDECGSKAQS